MNVNVDCVVLETLEHSASAIFGNLIWIVSKSGENFEYGVPHKNKIKVLRSMDISWQQIVYVRSVCVMHGN